jgi:hypothetical protein
MHCGAIATPNGTLSGQWAEGAITSGADACKRVACAALRANSIQSMPIRIDDAGRLADLADDESQLLVGNPTHVDLNVQYIVR